MASNSGQKTRNITLAKAGSANSICVAVDQNASDKGDQTLDHDLYTYDHISGKWAQRASGIDIQSIAAEQSTELELVKYIALSIDGDIIIIDKNSVYRDSIPLSIWRQNEIFFDPRAYALCIIDGCVFLCGAQGLFVSRDRSGHWSLPDVGLTKTGDGLAVESIKLLRKKDVSPLLRREVDDKFDQYQFYDIAGLTPNDIYICGKAGTILHWNGVTSSFVDRLTNIALTRLYIENPTTIWIRGLKGTLLRGNSFGGFVRAAASLPDDDFVSVAKFGGEIVTAIRSGPRAGLFHIIGNTLSQINNSPIINDLHTLNVSSNVLWLFGNRNIMRFDGTNWEQIFLPTE